MKLFYKLMPIMLIGLIAILLYQTPQMVAGQATATALNIGSKHNQSNNWAGYISTAGTFTSVSGSWIVPNVKAAANSADATWIGIGGITDKDLIQTGTQAIDNDNGQVTYQAWYEMLPGNSRRIPLTISSGDSITASVVQQSSNQWTISLEDVTTGQNYTTSVTYISSLSSAEWIEEMPVSGRYFIPLDNFGSVQFSDLSTVKDGKELTPAQADARSIVMINILDQVMAQPSNLGTDGASFAVNRTSVMPSRTVSPYVSTGWRRAGGHGYNPLYRQGHGMGRAGRGSQRFED